MRYNPNIVLAYFSACGLPPCVTEHKFHPTRKWRFDFAWVDSDSKVALEVDGGVWTRGAHGRGSGIVRDIEKGNAAVMLGWRVLRVQPRDLCMAETVEMIRTAIEISLASLWRQP